MTADLTTDTDIRTDLSIWWPWVRPTAWSRLDVDETNGEPGRLDIRREPAIIVEMLEGTATADWVFAGAERLLSGTRQVHGSSGPQSPKQTIGVDIRNRKWLELKWRHFARVSRSRRIRAAVAAIERAVVRYDLDADTMRWIAQDSDAEDI